MNWNPTIPHLEPSTRLETFVSTPDHRFVSAAVSVTGERLRTKLPNRSHVSYIGYYLSDNANCFLIYFSVERISTLPASWVSTTNEKYNLGSSLAGLGECNAG